MLDLFRRWKYWKDNRRHRHPCRRKSSSSSSHNYDGDNSSEFYQHHHHHHHHRRRSKSNPTAASASDTILITSKETKKSSAILPKNNISSSSSSAAAAAAAAAASANSDDDDLLNIFSSSQQYSTSTNNEEIQISEELRAIKKFTARMLVKLNETPDDPPTSSEDECVVCVTNRACLQTFPCGHRVLCRKCFLRTVQIAVTERKLPLRCVVCRSKIARLKHQSGIRGVTIQKQRTPPLPAHNQHNPNQSNTRSLILTKNQNKHGNGSPKKNRIDNMSSMTASSSTSALLHLMKKPPQKHMGPSPNYLISTPSSASISSIWSPTSTSSQATKPSTSTSHFYRNYSL